MALGANQGRRPELVGGGLIRSLGGWSALKELRVGDPRIKGDERILGSGDFVERVLKVAAETLAETMALRREGIGWESLAEKVMSEYDISPEGLADGRKAREIVRARSALCYQAVRKLRMTVRDVALRLRITPSAVSKLVSRGERLISGGK